MGKEGEINRRKIYIAEADGEEIGDKKRGEAGGQKKGIRIMTRHLNHNDDYAN